MTRIGRTRAAIVCALVLVAPVVAADDIKVVTSGAFSAALQELVPAFEAQTHHTVATSSGGSMGSAPDTIPNRLARGEPIDVVILAASALDDLIAQGKVASGTRVDLVRSRIGMAVRKGTPKPDVSTVEAFKRALLHAKSIAYSSSASGVYLSTDLFPRLGIADALEDKVRVIASGPVGLAVARGDAEIGFQQISELQPVTGIEIMTELPPEVQHVTIFSGGITVAAAARESARALLQFLASPAAAGAIRKSGLEPAR